MQSKKSKFLIGFMVFGMIISSLSNSKVQASTLEDELGIETVEEGTVVEDNNSLLTEGKSVEEHVYSMLRNSLLMVGTSGIKVMEDGEIYITGSTYAFQDVETVYVHLALQRSKNGEHWSVEANYSKAYYEESRVDAGYHLLVPKGYYYRVHSMHLVIHGEVSESYEGYTNGIMVD